MFRYMGLFWNAECVTSTATAVALQRRIQAMSLRWTPVFKATGAAVLVAACSHHLSARALFGGSGVVLGGIFPNLSGSRDAAPVRPAQFGARETQAVIESQGRILASCYWGNFTAFLLDPKNGGRLVFKDPCGSMPCHFTDLDGVQLLFSCLGDCRDLGLRFRVDWASIRARVANDFREVREPSLTGVSTVHRGECIRFDHGGTVQCRTQYWRPDFRCSADLAEPDVAQRAVRATVLGCVHSMAAGHSSVLAQVSGGLDSSIVLGVLSEMPSRPEITCYTLFVPASVCDERRWARQAAQRFGYRHVEVSLEPEKLIYKNLPALEASMEPGSYFTHWQKGPVERALATQYGASTMFTGEGGDAAFCATSYVFAVDHSLRRHGLGIRTIQTAVRVATRRDRTVWNVLGKALARRVLGDTAAHVERNLEPFRRLVSSDVRKSANENMENVLRMGLLALTPSFYDLSTSHHDAAPFMSSPLCAQPVVELCARIPVDVHFDGGRIRGLARRAFAGVVPAPILRRQWKDRPLLQLADVIALNLPFIREHLLDGELVKHRFLDRKAVEQALRSGPTGSSAISSEILTHLDLELWIRDSA
jgi:asparagine synthase (glutamine-hydrolysing)